MRPGQTRGESSEVIAVVPAAGRSRRIGKPKALLPFGRTTLIGATAEALQRGGAQIVVVVTRADDHALIDWASEHQVTRVNNPTPERGMLSSIQAGVAAAARLASPPTLPTLLISPADLPRLRAISVARVLRALEGGAAALALPTWRGRRGHPLAIAPRLVAEIAHLDPAVGLRQLLTLHADALVSVATDDPGVVQDIDTPEDYAQLTTAPPPESPT